MCKTQSNPATGAMKTLPRLVDQKEKPVEAGKKSRALSVHRRPVVAFFGSREYREAENTLPPGSTYSDRGHLSRIAEHQ